MQSAILPWGSLLAIAAASAAACLPALFVKTQVHLPLAPLLVVMGVLFALSYVALLFEFDLLNPAERQVVAGWLPVHTWRWRQTAGGAE